jgi:uncharacterized coiled-coil protein SlyX
VAFPQEKQIVDKINEIIDYINELEKEYEQTRKNLWYLDDKLNAKESSAKLPTEECERSVNEEWASNSGEEILENCEKILKPSTEEKCEECGSEPELIHYAGCSQSLYRRKKKTDYTKRAEKIAEWLRKQGFTSNKGHSPFYSGEALGDDKRFITFLEQLDKEEER